MWYDFALNNERIHPKLYPLLSLSNVLFKGFSCTDQSNLQLILGIPVSSEDLPELWKQTSFSMLNIVLRFTDELYWVSKGIGKTDFFCNPKILTINGIVRGTILVDGFELEIQSNFLLIDDISFGTGSALYT